ncbi:TonB-dependent receptor [Bradyrhizobium sp. LTSPM299]|uniref:TonB-dependent receptor n=1 Tax=Bradyrhizobium sp. LTSPM299 TaxID=1619233 RepID=UPI0005E68093|nr:TonB-dependent receptor [Bradyrhizobium sp. LTSPM299]KJC59023.1 TonB-dependent receptor [Bradyrhizobium sp. LTSPM299]
MNTVKAPRSLRFDSVMGSANDQTTYSGTKVSAVAGLIAVASFSGAEAQQSNLPPVTVDAPVARPRPATSQPSPDQVRARTALRRAARRNQQAQTAPVPFPNAGSLSADRNPYADAAAPYKVDHIQASGKFPEPILNTPKTITVLSKEVLADENATSLKQAVLNTAGVTLGTGEGGNAFGDRFFIRGFDTRNDVFIDGVRDPGVSVRENFFTEQVEILRGPGSSFAGRGTTGGAINIVTKQATTEKSFYNMDTTYASDNTKRVALDVNQVISPTLAIRAGGVYQDAGVEGRSFITDNRGGGFVALTWKPVDAVKVTADYVHTDIHGMPDFGVPYLRTGPTNAAGQYTTTAGGPAPEFGVNRDNFYGFVNRDFFEVHQDIATVNTEVKITPDLTFSNKVRGSESLLNYIGTIPESANVVGNTLTANTLSRYQPTDVVANQSEFTYKFDTGNWRHTMVAGVEVSRETSSIDSYAGLNGESSTGIVVNSSGAPTNVSITNPQYTFATFPTTPSLTGKPTQIAIDTTSGYLLDSANYRDLVILNGGIRLDDYGIKVSGYGTSGSVAGVFNSQAAQFDMPNFNLGLTFKPLPITSVYVAYATSSNPVGSEFDGTSAAYGGISPNVLGGANQIFGPMKNSAIEVGNKWELFDRHLLVTGALFQTNVTNARESVNVTAANPTASGCTYNVAVGGASQPCITAGAAYQIRGIDLEVAGKITDKWSVFGGLVLMKSEVTKSLVPSADPALYPTNVGLPLANIAHQSFSMLSKYQIDDRWEVGGQAVYRSKMYGGTLLAANQGTSLPSFWRFDSFAEAKIDKNWTAKLFVNNIFNKLYYTAFYQSAAPFTLEAPGRTVAFMLSARY